MSRWIVPVLLMTLLSGPGCPRPVGRCTYRQNKPRTGQVLITHIRHDRTAGGAPLVFVITEGFVETRFVFTPKEYERCLKAKGYGVKRTVPAALLPGGPCPPKQRISDCPWQ